MTRQEGGMFASAWEQTVSLLLPCSVSKYGAGNCSKSTQCKEWSLFERDGGFCYIANSLKEMP
jgi:hypothetical protein